MSHKTATSMVLRYGGHPSEMQHGHEAGHALLRKSKSNCGWQTVVQTLCSFSAIASQPPTAGLDAVRCGAFQC